MSITADLNHIHVWAHIGGGPHFEPVANSRRPARQVHKVICDCSQRGFKQRAFGPVLTWPKDEADWATEADHEAAQARKSPLTRARRP